MHEVFSAASACDNDAFTSSENWNRRNKIKVSRAILDSRVIGDTSLNVVTCT
jgi:hypothetical protein